MNLKIGAAIKDLRTRRGVTQEQLSVFLGVTPQAVSRWEAGNGYPDIELLPAIAGFFSVSTDALLGLDVNEREARRREILLAIQEQSETGGDNAETLQAARRYAAEFPADERIRMNVADVLCRLHMWEDRPDMDALEEAEKLYLTLADTTRDDAFRCEVLESLAGLYAVGLRDPFRLERTLRRLPTMKYSRESVASSLSRYGKNDPAPAQAYIEMLTASLGSALEQYIVRTLPNDPPHWDEKVRMLEGVLALYRFIFGDEPVYYNANVACLYRIIATYRVAQGRHDDALDSLERMCAHLQADSRVKAGDKFTSPFVSEMACPEQVQPFDPFHAHIVHNNAWYVLHNKLPQARYDPIRETPRFGKIVEALTAVAK